eukprot:scaffold299477_cov24-Tisochrysis_lutea.AAC.1
MHMCASVWQNGGQKWGSTWISTSVVSPQSMRLLKHAANSSTPSLPNAGARVHACSPGLAAAPHPARPSAGGHPGTQAQLVLPACMCVCEIYIWEAAPSRHGHRKDKDHTARNVCTSTPWSYALADQTLIRRTAWTYAARKWHSSMHCATGTACPQQPCTEHMLRQKRPTLLLTQSPAHRKGIPSLEWMLKGMARPKQPRTEHMLHQKRPMLLPMQSPAPCHEAQVEQHGSHNPMLAGSLGTVQPTKLLRILGTQPIYTRAQCMRTLLLLGTRPSTSLASSTESSSRVDALASSSEATATT